MMEGSCSRPVRADQSEQAEIFRRAAFNETEGE